MTTENNNFKIYEVLFTDNDNLYGGVIKIYDTREEAIQEAKKHTLFNESKHCVVYRVNYRLSSSSAIYERRTKTAVLK